METPEADTVPGAVDSASPSKVLEVLCAAVAVVVCGLLILGARAIEVRRETGGIDPRWWPELLGIFGLALAIILLLLVIIRPPFDRTDLERATRSGWARLIAAIGLSVVFVVAWSFVGFLVPAAIFLVAATFLFGGRGWRTLLLFPAATTAFIYVLFHLLLKVPL